MKLLLNILFFILAIFFTNISEAKKNVYDVAVPEIKSTLCNVESKNEASAILECTEPKGIPTSIPDIRKNL
ncbi:MAG: hypothetical protein ACKOXB_04430 [Flavobacteriales bacterium]